MSVSYKNGKFNTITLPSTAIPTQPPAEQLISATYSYDGDGKMVMSVVNGETTYYIGRYYQKTNDGAGTTTTQKHYMLGMNNIAVRTKTDDGITQTDTLNWILGDHLGSANMTANENGSWNSTMKYTAFGELREATGITITDYLYTGQRSETATGLYNYVARWYDPQIGHFISADTIVPGAGNPSGYDRYRYVGNNPTVYNDPSGHLRCDSGNRYIAEGNCSDYSTKDILNLYNVVPEGDFTSKELSTMYLAITDTAGALRNATPNNLGDSLSRNDAFKGSYKATEKNPLKIKLITEDTCNVNCFGWAKEDHLIWIYRFWNDPNTSGDLQTDLTILTVRFFVHELGHVFSKSIGRTPYTDLENSTLNNRNGFAVDNGGFNTWQQSDRNIKTEIYADMFIGWVYDTWYSGKDLSQKNAGIGKSNFMNNNMGKWITASGGYQP